MTKNQSQHLEGKYLQDQLTDRVLIKDMGRGVKELKIEFENPIIVS